LIHSELPELAPSDKYIVAAFVEWLAERVHDARLSNDKRLLDRTDFQLWLQEVAAEVRKK
jgi:hypothetical protein